MEHLRVIQSIERYNTQNKIYDQQSNNILEHIISIKLNENTLKNETITRRKEKEDKKIINANKKEQSNEISKEILNVISIVNDKTLSIKDKIKRTGQLPCNSQISKEFKRSIIKNLKKNQKKLKQKKDNNKTLKGILQMTLLDLFPVKSKQKENKKSKFLSFFKIRKNKKDKINYIDDKRSLEIKQKDDFKLKTEEKVILNDDKKILQNTKVFAINNLKLELNKIFSKGKNIENFNNKINSFSLLKQNKVQSINNLKLDGLSSISVSNNNQEMNKFLFNKNKLKEIEKLENQKNNQIKKENYRVRTK